ncbi:hypothetical protein NEIRO03_2558 [Nematocida sp. AWRm78]|nr:hypothetical protein NEIRO03_2558 [Nematocida sp. AWRm78]
MNKIDENVQNTEIIRNEKVSDISRKLRKTKNITNTTTRYSYKESVPEHTYNYIWGHIKSIKFKKVFAYNTAWLLLILGTVYTCMITLEKLGYSPISLEMFPFQWVSSLFFIVCTGICIFLKNTKYVKLASTSIREYLVIIILILMFITNITASSKSTGFYVYDILCMGCITSIWAFKSTFTDSAIKGYFIRKTVTICMGIILIICMVCGYISTYYYSICITPLLCSTLFLSGYIMSLLVVQFNGKFSSMERIITDDMVRILFSTVFLFYITMLGFNYRIANDMAIERTIISPTLMTITTLSILQLLVKSCEADILYYSIKNKYRYRQPPAHYLYKIIFRSMVGLFIISLVLVFIFDTRYRMSIPSFLSSKPYTHSLSILKLPFGDSIGNAFSNYK